MYLFVPFPSSERGNISRNLFLIRLDVIEPALARTLKYHIHCFKETDPSKFALLSYYRILNYRAILEFPDPAVHRLLQEDRLLIVRQKGACQIEIVVLCNLS